MMLVMIDVVLLFVLLLLFECDELGLAVSRISNLLQDGGFAHGHLAPFKVVVVVIAAVVPIVIIMILVDLAEQDRVTNGRGNVAAAIGTMDWTLLVNGFEALATKIKATVAARERVSEIGGRHAFEANETVARVWGGGRGSGVTARQMNSLLGLGVVGGGGYSVSMLLVGRANSIPKPETHDGSFGTSRTLSFETTDPPSFVFDFLAFLPKECTAGDRGRVHRVPLRAFVQEWCSVGGRRRNEARTQYGFR